MHLTDEQLNEYLDHETFERDKIEAHLSTCTECAARLSALQDLFTELESLPKLAFTQPIASRLTLPSSRPMPLPRSLTLTVTLQAALALLTIIVTAPFVRQFLSPYFLDLSMPSPGDVIMQVQSQWTRWLDALSQLQLPTIPEIPVVELSSIFVMLAVVGVSLLWLIGNGLLLRNQNK